MPDRLPTPPSSSKEGPSEDGPRQSVGPDTESTGSTNRAGKSGNPGKADNPFAPPPEGSPDRPWQPRQQQGDGDKQGEHGGGSRWSSRQPGRSSGPFGQRPGEPEGQGGGPGGGLRWDPTDPVQRRARYALLSGMWGFFFALFSWTYVGLLLGALALYWGISSLRSDSGAKAGSAKADVDAITGRGPSEPARQQPGGQPQAQQQGARPQKTSAISGIVVGSLALAVVAATFTVQMVYRDYYTCVNDALTTTAAKNCGDLLPEQIRPLLEAAPTEE